MPEEILEVETSQGPAVLSRPWQKVEAPKEDWSALKPDVQPVVAKRLSDYRGGFLGKSESLAHRKHQYSNRERARRERGLGGK